MLINLPDCSTCLFSCYGLLITVGGVGDDYSQTLASWCTGVCMTGRLGISLITSSQPLMLHLAVFVYKRLRLLIRIVSLFLTADLARSAVGLFSSWPDSLN